jgi:hypothetical protein
MVEMLETAAILRRATERSLVSMWKVKSYFPLTLTPKRSSWMKSDAEPQSRMD